jgi:hypothetical protein
MIVLEVGSHGACGLGSNMEAICIVTLETESPGLIIFSLFLGRLLGCLCRLVGDNVSIITATTLELILIPHLADKLQSCKSLIYSALMKISTYYYISKSNTLRNQRYLCRLDALHLHIPVRCTTVKQPTYKKWGDVRPKLLCSPVGESVDHAC